MTPPQRNKIQLLRHYLDSEGYNEKALTEQLGQAWPPAPGQAEVMLEKSSEVTACNVLIRLFLLGIRVDESLVTEFFPSDLYRYCLQAQLLERAGDHVQALIVIVPIENLLFASDAFRLLATPGAHEFVLPASTHSANFLRYLTIRKPLKTALDLGCGCGMHALFAARHCEHVVATDISAAAIHYTKFNAALNDINNIECLEGSLFDPVKDRQFDLIISNPPFVLSPSNSFVYRDNAMELDQFCRVLVESAPSHLHDGGHLQMLCEWVELPNEAWPQRVSGWVRGCDAWILHAAAVTPQQYVTTRSQDISGDSVSAGSASEWLDYLTERRVQRIHPGMMTLRKRAANNWLHVQNLIGDVTAEAGDAVLGGIAAVDFLENCDGDSLLHAVLDRAAGIRSEPAGDEGELLLTLDNSISVEAQVDTSVATYLNCFDGTKTVRECNAEFSNMSDGDIGKMTPELLAIVRVFVSRGFLRPRDFA